MGAGDDFLHDAVQAQSPSSRIPPADFFEVPAFDGGQERGVEMVWSNGFDEPIGGGVDQGGNIGIDRWLCMIEVGVGLVIIGSLAGCPHAGLPRGLPPSFPFSRTALIFLRDRDLPPFSPPSLPACALVNGRMAGICTNTRNL